MGAGAISTNVIQYEYKNMYFIFKVLFDYLLPKTVIVLERLSTFDFGS